LYHTGGFSVIILRQAHRVLGGLVLLAAAGSVQAQEADESVYRLDAGDRVKVVVYGHEDLSGEFEVDGEGRVSLPLIQEVAAAGLSLRDLEAAISDRLKPDYLRNPRVSVEVLNYRPFYILGEVKTPGSYPFVNGMTVINAIALAGGYTYRARSNKVVILRGNGPEQERIPAGSDTPVLPGDVIEVPERLF
jgi:polysaccharide export outer membrane protein